MPYDKKPGAVGKMYDKKGKQIGLMVEGSMAYMDHGSAAHHAGKSQLHKDPNKDMPNDGHKHKGGKNPTQPEGKQLMDTSGAVGQMSPYKFTGMSGGSAMHNEDPELQKAIDKREKIEMIRQKQQAAHEARDRHRNELRAKKMKLRKEKGFAPKKLTGSVEVGRIN